MIVSIIITVFNKEEYIKRCLDSCVVQESSLLGVDYEIIVVNDGSSDNSAGIIGEYSIKFPSIAVIEQKNQGLSMARNNGLKIAKGDYIWFVDADDAISKSSIQSVKTVVRDNPDIIPIYAKYDGDDTIRNNIPETTRNGKDVILSEKWEECAPFFIIKKAFLIEKSIFFIPGIYHEDSEFTPRILCNAKSIAVIPDILYTIYSVPNSITQVPRPKRAYDYIFVSEKDCELIMEMGGYNSPVGKSLSNYIAIMLNTALFIIIKNDIAEQKRFSVFIYQHRNIFKTMKYARSIKYRIEGYLYCSFPKHILEIYKFLSSIIRN